MSMTKCTAEVRAFAKKMHTALEKHTALTKNQSQTILWETYSKHIRKKPNRINKPEEPPTPMADNPQLRLPFQNNIIRIEDLISQKDERLGCDMERGKRYEIGFTTSTATEIVECTEILNRHERIVQPVNMPNERVLVDLRNKDLSFWTID